MKRKQDGQELEFERLPKKPPISLLILLLTQRSNHRIRFNVEHDSSSSLNKEANSCCTSNLNKL